MASFVGTAPAVRAGLQLIRVAAGLAAGAVLLLMQMSALGAEAVPLALRVALGALVPLALVRPDLGLIAAAALTPFGAWVAATNSVASVRLAEAPVLASLTGAVIRFSWGDRALKTAGANRLLRPAVLFAAAAMASAAVQLSLTQVGIDSAWLGARRLTASLTSGYLFGSPEFRGLVDAARLIEGIALFFIIVVLARHVPMLPRRLIVVSVAAGAAAALINLSTMVQMITNDAEPGRLFMRFLGGRSLGIHIRDINATASYFLLLTLSAVGGLVAARGRFARVSWLTAAVLLGAAYWFAGSRAAIAAGLLAGAAAAAFVIFKSVRSHTRRFVLLGVAVLLVIVVLPLALIAVYPDRSDSRESVNIRAEFLATSVRMLATRPLLGVGVGRYYPLSGRFMSPDLRATYPLENAHNNFMQIGAELGLIGLALFIWLLAAAGAVIWSGGGVLRDPPLAVMASGLAGFLTTCLTGHPLLVGETAYPFWIILGAACAMADARQPEATARLRARSSGPLAIACLALAISVPARVQAEVDALTLAELESGLYGWETERPSGIRFRWMSGRASLFVAPEAEEVELPLRALFVDGTTDPIRVEIAVGGRSVRKLALHNEEWVTARIAFPAETGTLSRIDLGVDRTWSPSRISPGNRDRRNLGVKVGEIRVVRQRNPKP